MLPRILTGIEGVSRTVPSMQINQQHTYSTRSNWIPKNSKLEKLSKKMKGLIDQLNNAKHENKFLKKELNVIKIRAKSVENNTIIMKELYL